MEWDRLAQAIIDRRAELGYRTREQMAAAAGLSSRLLGDLEKNRRQNYDRITLARVEGALDWEPGTIQRILTPHPIPKDRGLVGISETSSQVIALLDRDELNLTAEEREKLRATIDLVIWPYVKTHLIREQAIDSVAREQAERRAERERREGAGG